jgi:hypothetical protein
MLAQREENLYIADAATLATSSVDVAASQKQ